jgi:hypothetical protein
VSGVYFIFNGLVYLASTALPKTACSSKATPMSISADMLRFDNTGQSFISARHGANLIQVVETARLETLGALRDSSSAARTLAFIGQALVGFRLQYANAYVLHEYAHAEMQHRLATNGIMVGRTPTGNGVGVMQNDPYLKNLLHMALGGKNPFDFSYRGVGIDSVSPTPPEFIGDRPQALFIGSDTNLNSFLAQRYFEAMIAGDTSPSWALNYHINKAFAPEYFMLDANIGGDPSNYVEKLTAQGIDTSVGQICTYQWAALLLSTGIGPASGRCATTRKTPRRPHQSLGVLRVLSPDRRQPCTGLSFPHF